jgi:hypothetical protein
MDSSFEEKLQIYAKDLLKNIISIVGEENKNKFCLIFGKDLLFSDQSIDKVLEEQKIFKERHLYTVIYCPSVKSTKSLLSDYVSPPKIIFP